MNTVIQKSKCVCVGLLLTLTCSFTVLADDTELLLLSPSSDARRPPNVLLIIDTSGSMEDLVKTREIYDSSKVYPANLEDSCDSSYLYWTLYPDVNPSCTSNQRVRKSSFKCSSGLRQLAGVGLYRQTMAQFRGGSPDDVSASSGLDSTSWQLIEPGNETDIIECAADRGSHGDGVDMGALFAQRGGNVEPYTSNVTDEVSWGSWPTSQSVTMYDGNYLNYLSNPVIGEDSKINIVKDTLIAVLNSIDSINLGLMRFHSRDGGTVLQAIKDLDANRATLIRSIERLFAGGATPLSETLYEAALYWRGLPAYYGENIDEAATDPDALIQLSPEIYRQPQVDTCSKNFNVLLSDGGPNRDFDTPQLVDSLPNWSGTLGYTGCTGTEQGDCLDDIAEYLFTGDISSASGLQVVTTHTIGFDFDLPLFEQTAQRGGGEYFLADNVESLTLALLEIVNNVTDRSLSFAAPAVAVNTFNRTRNFNDLYLTTFAASEKFRWPGNLKKYKIDNGQIIDSNALPAVNPVTGLFFDSARSFWSSDADGNDTQLGGAAEHLPDPSVRKLYTNNTVDPNLSAADNAIDISNESLVAADFGLTGADGEPSLEQIVRWARGEDVTDEDLNPDTTVRKSMGDPLHSQPAAVVYGGTETNPDIVVFTATNDGYVHAINAANGEELWAFIPKEHLSRLPNLYFNPDSAFKSYGVDGDIVPIMADRDNDGIIESADGDFVYILFGMRRGGSAFYALDVTDRNNPKVVWRADAAEFGQSWSQPTVARMMIDDPALNSDKAVVVIGGGYDPVHDTIGHPASADTQGAGIFFLDMQSGDILWRAGADVNANLQLTGMTRSIPAKVTVIDSNGDSFADRMYAADTGGQLMRFDIFNGKSPNGTGVDALVTGGVVAQLGAEGLSTPTNGDTRRFYTSPDVSIFNDNLQNRRFLAISIGSGYRAHPLDNSNDDRFYSIRDENVFNPLSQDEYNNFTPVTDAELVEISGQVGTIIGQNQRGWKFTLPADQKVLSTSVTFNNEIFFVAFTPNAAGVAACSPGTGQNFLYRVAVANGDPIAQFDAIVPGEEDQSRRTELAQGGIAPTPRFLFPSAEPDCTGEECAPPPIGCVGVECFDPGFENVPVRTLWTQDGIE